MCFRFYLHDEGDAGNLTPVENFPKGVWTATVTCIGALEFDSCMAGRGSTILSAGKVRLDNQGDGNGFANLQVNKVALYLNIFLSGRDLAPICTYGQVIQSLT